MINYICKRKLKYYKSSLKYWKNSGRMGPGIAERLCNALHRKVQQADSLRRVCLGEDKPSNGE